MLRYSLLLGLPLLLAGNQIENALRRGNAAYERGDRRRCR